MEMKITQLSLRQTQRYPWTHRVDFSMTNTNRYFQIDEWIYAEQVPGIWANFAFYTTDVWATLIALKWTDEGK